MACRWPFAAKRLPLRSTPSNEMKSMGSGGRQGPPSQRATQSSTGAPVQAFTTLVPAALQVLKGRQVVMHWLVVVEQQAGQTVLSLQLLVTMPVAGLQVWEVGVQEQLEPVQEVPLPR